MEVSYWYYATDSRYLTPTWPRRIYMYFNCESTSFVDVSDLVIMKAHT